MSSARLPTKSQEKALIIEKMWKNQPPELQKRVQAWESRKQLHPGKKFEDNVFDDDYKYKRKGEDDENNMKCNELQNRLLGDLSSEPPADSEFLSLLRISEFFRFI